MAKCEYCDLERLDDRTLKCPANRRITFPDGAALPAVRYREESEHDSDARCPDCNVLVGRPHHPGCDREECPRCSGQLISCGCLDLGDTGDPENGALEDDENYWIARVGGARLGVVGYLDAALGTPGHPLAELYPSAFDPVSKATYEHTRLDWRFEHGRWIP
jgi:hypothetical protein